MVDQWLLDTTIPAIPPAPHRIAIVALVIGPLPPWTDYFSKSASYSKGIDFVVFVTEKNVAPKLDVGNVHFKHISKAELARRLTKTMNAMGIPTDAVSEHIFSEQKCDDLKPLFGALFQDYLVSYTHWGWMSFDGFFGDMTPLLNDLKSHDVVTYPNGYQPGQAIHLSKELTVFRNIEYFNKYMGATYVTKSKETVTIAKMFLQDGHHNMAESYAIWFALRHPDITFKCDYSKQEPMPNNPTYITSFLFTAGLLQIRTIGPYTQWGLHDAGQANAHVKGYASDHSCHWFPRNWSFRCVCCSGGIAYTWKNGEMSAEKSDKSTENLMMGNLHSWRHPIKLDDPSGFNSDTFVVLMGSDGFTHISPPSKLPEQIRFKWTLVLEGAPEHLDEHAALTPLVRWPHEGKVTRFPFEDPDGPVDQWLVDMVIPPRSKGPYKVALISFWFGPLPNWIDYFAKSVSFSANKGIDFFMFVTEDHKPKYDAPNLFFKHISPNEISRRVAKVLRASGLANILDGDDLGHLYTGDKGADLKPLYGALFEEMLKPYTHWGFIDIDSLFGDLSPMLKDLENYDVVSYPDGYHINQAVYLAGPLNVFRNIEYFRKYFGATFRNTEGEIMQPGRLFQKPGHWVMDENYGIWFALRHPSITLKCDFSRQEDMGHNPHESTGYLLEHGVGKIITLHGYGQWGHDDPNAAKIEMERLNKYQHSCLEKWYHFQPNWAFRCLNGAAGLAYTWKDGEMSVERSSKTLENTMYLHIHDWKSGLHPLLNEYESEVVFSVAIGNNNFFMGPPHLLPAADKAKWERFLKKYY